MENLNPRARLGTIQDFQPNTPKFSADTSTFTLKRHLIACIYTFLACILQVILIQSIDTQGAVMPDLL